MGTYYYFVCRQSKRYVCLGKMISTGRYRFQGMYSDAKNEWICDDRFLLCIARLVLENPGSEFVLDSESNILGIDDFDEISFDELISDFGTYKAPPNSP